VKKVIHQNERRNKMRNITKPMRILRKVADLLIGNGYTSPVERVIAEYPETRNLL